MSPDHRQHRGAHPADAGLFGEDSIAVLREAARDLSWLLGRGYAARSALKLVGDRHNLTDRQRLAVSRAACADADKQKRRLTCVSAKEARDQPIVVDGFNLLITIEAALSGGVLIRCGDG